MVWQAASPIEAAPRMIATFDPCYAQGVGLASLPQESFWGYASLLVSRDFPPPPALIVWISPSLLACAFRSLSPHDTGGRRGRFNPKTTASHLPERW